MLENTRPKESQLKECLVSSPCSEVFIKSPNEIRVEHKSAGDLWVHIHYKQEELPESFVLRFAETDQAEAFMIAYQTLSCTK